MSEGLNENEILISEKNKPPQGDGDVAKMAPETVVPTNGKSKGGGEASEKAYFDVENSMEHNPPEKVKFKDGVTKGLFRSIIKKYAEYRLLNVAGDIENQSGRKLFFSDGKSRIDYVLAWNTKQKENDEQQEIRDVFEANLEIEGLDLEYDIKNGRDIQYVKLHATWEVLTRYAEIMKIRMPMKEVPEEIKTKSVWEILTETFSKLLSPFDLDPKHVPPLPKKFTCVYQRDKEYLFAIPAKKELFFSHSTRSRIVDYIVRRKKYTDNGEAFAFGIKRLLSEGVYVAAYPLHEGSWKPWTKASIRRLLYQHWAHWSNFYRIQPLDYIRTYFGERIGLYFTWLGFYTWMLVPASIVGLIVFIYSVATINNNIIAQETCDSSANLTMCPQCDVRCPYWDYSVSCSHARASHMFDNGATVFFAVFMSLWGTVFLEFWKREQAAIQFKWNLMNFEEEEQPPRPEYLMRLGNTSHRKKHPVSGEEEPYVPFWRKKVPVMFASFSVMLFLVCIAVGVMIGVVVYRMAVLSALYLRDEELLYKNASMVTTATAACINLIMIMVLNYFYEYVAVKLTDWECLRTQSEYDNSLTIKLYVLQFVNYYSSIIHIAFLKGRFIGRPGAYKTLFSARQEECQAGGCLIELAIQLAIIFVGKQLIQNNIMEILLPRIKKRVKKWFTNAEESGQKVKQPWEKDFFLEPLGHRGLFNEYLEMLLQFGFVTIFVAAFPLAPLFALLNNVIEIRADANKFVTQLQRPMAARAQTIGIWYEILYAVSRIAIITNALIIAFTSGYIHRLVYQQVYSPDGSLRGYVNHSMSYFNVSDFAPEDRYNNSDVQICRYKDFREPPWSEKKYEYTKEFWHVLAAQFIFIVVFENFVVLTTSAIAYFIPDMPRKLREQVRREAYLTNEIILKTELEIARGEDGVLTDKQMKGIRKRVRATTSHGPDRSASASTIRDVENGHSPESESIV